MVKSCGADNSNDNDIPIAESFLSTYVKLTKSGKVKPATLNTMVSLPDALTLRADTMLYVCIRSNFNLRNTLMRGIPFRYELVGVYE